MRKMFVVCSHRAFRGSCGSFSTRYLGYNVCASSAFRGKRPQTRRNALCFGDGFLEDVLRVFCTVDGVRSVIDDGDYARDERDTVGRHDVRRTSFAGHVLLNRGPERRRDAEPLPPVHCCADLCERKVLQLCQRTSCERTHRS